MLTPRHRITAQTVYLGACVVAAHPPAPAEALAAALISDLGSRQSYSGRLLPQLRASLRSDCPVSPGTAVQFAAD